MKEPSALWGVVITFLGLAALSLAAGVVQIELPPETAVFKPGAGSEIANGQCLTCHSVEYVTTQPRMPRSFWVVTIKKMQRNYGAPTAEEQIEPLADYLARNYGSETNPAPSTTISLPSRPTPPSGPGLTPLGGSLAAKYWCVSCHSVSAKLVGPPFKDIAAKYRHDSDAFAKVANQIRKGGSGKWGSVVMPPFPMVSDAETKALAEWILSCR